VSDVERILSVMDEYCGEYRRRRSGKWEGHRRGARNRRYFEQAEGDETGAHNSGK